MYAEENNEPPTFYNVNVNSLQYVCIVSYIICFQWCTLKVNRVIASLCVLFVASFHCVFCFLKVSSSYWSLKT